MTDHPPRNLGLDLVRVTEAAALTAGRWIGRGQSAEADAAAAEAMLEALNTLDMNGRVILGEESKLRRHSPLDSGKKVGTGYGPDMDVLVDPIDGARLLKDGRSGAVAVAVVAPAGSMLRVEPAAYMEKIVVDRGVGRKMVPEAMDAPAAWTLALISRLKNKPIRDLIVFMLERDRHTDLVEEIRAAGARVWLRADGDILGALLALEPNIGADVLMGIGGAAEGMMAACAAHALGGAVLARLAPQSDAERHAVEQTGLDTHTIFTEHELVTDDDLFFVATGITDGPLLKGVSYLGDRAETHSIILRGSTGTRRIIYAEHTIKRLFG